MGISNSDVANELEPSDCTTLEKGPGSSDDESATHRTSPPTPPAPPEVSRIRAGLAVVGAFLTLFVSIGFVNAFGIFEQYYLTHQLSNHNSSDISWIGAVNLFCIFAGAAPVGIINDRYGQRVLTSVGSVVLLFALCMTSISRRYYQIFLSQGVLLGLSFSLLITPCLATIPLFYRANRALAMGIVIGGSSVGGIVWPIILRPLLPAVGFGWTMRIVALICTPSLVLTILTVYVPPQLRGNIRASGVSDRSAVLAVVKNTRFIFVSFGLLLTYLGLFSPFFFLPTYGESIGVGQSLSFYLISILNGTSFLGRVLPGFLADKYGPFNLLFGATISSGILCLCWIAIHNTGGVIAFAILYGFTSGSVLSLQIVCAASLVKPERIGTAVGLLQGVLSIGGLFGTPIAGRLWDKFGLSAIAGFSGTMVMIGAASIAVSRYLGNKALFAKV